MVSLGLGGALNLRDNRRPSVAFEALVFAQFRRDGDVDFKKKSPGRGKRAFQARIDTAWNCF